MKHTRNHTAETKGENNEQEMNLNLFIGFSIFCLWRENEEKLVLFCL